ncbi:hypothetical protein ACJQWK_06822 [Exserohilum turcicum]
MPPPTTTATTAKEFQSYSYSHHHHHTRQKHNTTPPTLSYPLTIPPPLSLAPPARPTVYIITYSTDLIRSETSAISLLASQVPRRDPRIPHLYTIDARNMQPPSAALCERYSGISPLIQDIVMQDACARRAASTAVRELLRFGDEENRRERRGQGARRLEVSMSVGL